MPYIIFFNAANQSKYFTLHWYLVMPCDALWYSVMPCGTMWCLMVLCEALWCCMMPCDAVRSLVMLCEALWYCVKPCDAVWCLVMLCDALWCCVRPCDAVWRLVMLCEALGFCDAVWSLVMPCEALWGCAKPCDAARGLMWCCVKPCDVVWCSVMWCDALRCSLKPCDVVWCVVMPVKPCDIVWCHVMLHDTVWCHVMLHETVWCLVILRWRHGMSCDTMCFLVTPCDVLWQGSRPHTFPAAINYAIADKIIIGLFLVCVGCVCDVWCVIDHKFYLPKSCMVYNILLHCFNISGCLTTAQCQAKCHAMDINHKGWFSFFRSVLTPSTLPVMIDAPSLPILITWGP